jgi:hypothetical protein
MFEVCGEPSHKRLRAEEGCRCRSKEIEVCQLWPRSSGEQSTIRSLLSKTELRGAGKSCGAGEKSTSNEEVRTGATSYEKCVDDAEEIFEL